MAEEKKTPPADADSGPADADSGAKAGGKSPEKPPEDKPDNEKRLKDTQAQLTKVSQDMAELRKKAESLVRENEDYKAMMAEVSSEESAEEGEGEDDFDPLTMDGKELSARIQKAVSQTVEKALPSIFNAAHELAVAKMRSPEDGLPKFTDVERDVHNLLKRAPGLTYEEAYRFVTMDAKVEATKKRAVDEIAEKRRAELETYRRPRMTEIDTSKIPRGKGLGAALEYIAKDVIPHPDRLKGT